MSTPLHDEASSGASSETHTIDCDGFRWHVETAGEGPVCLLLHGTGASSHSWHRLMPALTRHHRVVALDLPGHGRTRCPAGFDHSLPQMASAVLALLEQHAALFSGPVRTTAAHTVADGRPDGRPGSAVTGIGHSAGAAILAQIALTRPDALTRLISINGALVPLNGLARLTFSPIARASANTGMLTSLFTRRVRDPAVIQRMLRQTGSSLDDAAVREYQALCLDPEHVRGALRMMAAWRLEKLYPQLHRLGLPVHLIAGARDRMIAPRDAYRLHGLIPGSTLDVLARVGHLAHEEQPGDVIPLILGYTQTDPPVPTTPAEGRAHVTANGA